MGEIDDSELMSSGEIAAELGWANSGTAATLWRRGTFPAPVIDKPRARLWRRTDVEEWARTAHRRPWRRSPLESQRVNAGCRCERLPLRRPRMPAGQIDLRPTLAGPSEYKDG